MSPPRRRGRESSESSKVRQIIRSHPGTKDYFVYILASQPKGTLYIGVTNNLYRRVQEHKHELVEGFTKKYRIDQLVHFERFRHIQSAIRREKQLKKWNRAWKIRLIEETNPGWDNLFYRYCPDTTRPS